ncbi:hypothetical protein RIF29_24518 [Crotalaria pallida]|uniref:F-box domain-containing protein n=1 Tax=Crotalaria pallida TaxID=3830 RepID=A0AAN9EKJ1_CROPI
MLFPIDVVVEILVLLPAKSLMRFKCVDRSWNDLFRTPTFINKNMKKKKKNERLLLCWSDHLYQILTEDEELLECPPFPPLPSRRLLIHFSNCNPYKGVIFYVDEYHLNNYDYDCREHTDSWTVLDIKDHVLPVKLEILSDSYHLVNGRDSIHVNGVCYWTYSEQYDRGGILCFDLGNNQFRKLELPPQTYTNQNPLTEIHDSLAFVVHQFGGADIWVYEQGTSCWTKKYVFKHLNSTFVFFQLWRDGPEFLTHCGEYSETRHLASRNSDGHLVSHFEQVSLEIPVPFEICKYVESIAPLSFS